MSFLLSVVSHCLISHETGEKESLRLRRFLQDLSCPVANRVITGPAGGTELPSSRGLTMSRRFELPLCMRVLPVRAPQPLCCETAPLATRIRKHTLEKAKRQCFCREILRLGVPSQHTHLVAPPTPPQWGIGSFYTPGSDEHGPRF